MRLNNKLLLTLGIVWIVCLGLAYVVSQKYLMQSFYQLENKYIIRNINRVHQAIDQVSYALGTFTNDWAHWNDAYDYVEGKNPEFVPKNFYIDGFVNSNINLIIYLDRQGKILVGTAADLDNKKLIAYPAGLEKYIYPSSPLSNRTDLNNDMRGLISLPSGIMLVAGSAVTWGDASKPAIGTMVTGRNFSTALLKKISEATSLDLALYPSFVIASDPHLEKTYNEAIHEKDGNYIELINKDISYGYTLLRDILGEPIGMIRVTVPREIFLTGSHAVTYYLGGFLVFGLFFAGLIWYLLRLLILNRLEFLNRQIRSMGEKNDYKQRAIVEKNDELSSLARQFNTLMQTIEASHEQLEEQVDILSKSEKNLENANTKLLNEIGERKRLEQKAAALHNKLILAARQAGMADITNGILHNVGNILNSVVTSIEIGKEKLESSKAFKLAQLAALLNEHKNDLSSFVAVDKNGIQVIEYVSMLAKIWETDNQALHDEIIRLNKNVNHIKSVINMQQSMSTSVGMIEEVRLIDVIEDALILDKTRYKQSKIQIVREFEFDEVVSIDRMRLLHIMANLIKNSVDSLVESQEQEKRIVVRTQKADDSHFMIQVTDNGLGIQDEIKEKIFTHGFTTKKSGHGFGLHTSAISVQEMHGQLSVDSSGLGKGATFKIVLPIKPPETKAHPKQPESRSEATPS